jgi:hypothetical protein
LVVERAVNRSLQRMGSKGTLDAIVADFPNPRLEAKVVERAVMRLVGRHEVHARILPGNYPNLVEFQLPGGDGPVPESRQE